MYRFDGHHSGGSSFVYVSVIKKKKIGKKSQYMVSSPETGSDPPIGSDRESGHDNLSHALRTLSDIYLGDVCFFSLNAE